LPVDIAVEAYGSELQLSLVAGGVGIGMVMPGAGAAGCADRAPAAGYERDAGCGGAVAALNGHARLALAEQFLPDGRRHLGGQGLVAAHPKKIFLVSRRNFRPQKTKPTKIWWVRQQPGPVQVRTGLFR